MTNSTKLIGLIMTATLWSGLAVAQGPAFSNLGDDMPPDLTLPSPSGGEAAPIGSMQPSMEADGYCGGVQDSMPTSAGEGAPQGFSVPQVDGYDLGAECEYPQAGGLWNQIAPIESTGTWLQRGFWYAEADAVIYNRLWNRDDRLYAADDADVERVDFFPLLLDTNRLMVLDSAQPGRDAAVRVTLGHFLFRDSRNRDHTVEFTTLGGGDWEQNRLITSQAPFGLFVPFILDGGNLSFDGSSRQSLEYSSSIKNFEMNYRVRQRLGHDQLVMDPNGGWHRATNGGFEREYLAGLRMMELEDILDWRAEDIAVDGNDGRYLIRTGNDLFGFQMGGGQTYQAPRWSVGLFGKGGVFLNDAVGRNQLTFTANDDNDSNLRLSDSELSFVGEFKIQSRFHITPNTSIRAAYEMMYITSVALAPSQVNFIPEFAYLNTTGDPFYHGASFGFEGYW